MPTYDVQCSQCGFEDAVSLSISEVPKWDQEAQCPSCQKSNTSFRRIIKQAPATGGKSRPRASLKSSDTDDMRHKAFKKRDSDQISAAVENVRKGTFEGF